MKRSRFIARVAVFSALAYVLAYASFYIPNVSLIFVVVFAAGVVYGRSAGILVGGIGEFLWTVFNPYGMAPISTTIGQIIGMVLVGLIGGMIFSSNLSSKLSRISLLYYALLGLLCGFVFQLVVNLIDAAVYGPFWAYLIGGLTWTAWSIAVNGLIFAACYPVIIKLKEMESRFDS